MKFIPLFKVSNMPAAIQHYTKVLDFVMTSPDDGPDSPVVDLGHEQTELQITTHESGKLFGSVVYVWVTDVDMLFARFMGRGLGNPSPLKYIPSHILLSSYQNNGSISGNRRFAFKLVCSEPYKVGALTVQLR